MNGQLGEMNAEKKTKTDTLAPLLNALLEETQAASGAAHAADLALKEEMEELEY
jgi:hypothetical protein